jgi:hypothetical protein
MRFLRYHLCNICRRHVRRNLRMQFLRYIMQYLPQAKLRLKSSASALYFKHYHIFLYSLGLIPSIWRKSLEK